MHVTQCAAIAHEILSEHYEDVGATAIADAYLAALAQIAAGTLSTDSVHAWMVGFLGHGMEYVERIRANQGGDHGE